MRTAVVLTSILLLFAGIAVRAADEPIQSESGNTVQEPEIVQADRDHWSFRPLLESERPQVRDERWCRTTVDRFLLAAMEEAGVQPLPEADRVTLLRRVTFDLTGLPPTVAEIDAFCADESSEAFERVVERLLNSQAYAERSAQHWLDLARFAETDGFEHDKSRPEAWKYRDWVIEAFAADMPYPEFIRRQIAGDLLAKPDLAAIGFLTAGPDMPDLNEQDERRHVVLNDLTSTVGSVFLGLQVGCASCHDHKYDPISQLDFYRLRAYFDPMFEFKRDKLVTLAKSPNWVYRSRLMVRGDFRRPGPPVKPSPPRIAVTSVAAEVSRPDRLKLAEWLGSSDNPLAMRIIVNRIWQQHFVNGISRSPSDFGIMGEWPSHPELLDWLAGEFVRQGSSFRNLHRLLVTSSAYRTASRPDGSTDSLTRWEQIQAHDKDGELLTHMPRRRLEGEAIRDAMLMVSSDLNPRPHGPGVRPPLPEEIVSTLLKDQWEVTQDEREHNRRSVYLFVRRNLRYPLFDAFDKPDTNQSCPRRNRSTIAPQALMLLNSKFSLDCATNLADELEQLHPADTPAQVTAAYRRCLGRMPDSAELAEAETFLQEIAETPNDISPLTTFCLALFNLNEFIYID